MPIQIARLEQTSEHIKGDLSRLDKNLETIQSDVKLILKALK